MLQGLKGVKHKFEFICDRYNWIKNNCKQTPDSYQIFMVQKHFLFTQVDCKVLRPTDYTSRHAGQLAGGFLVSFWLADFFTWIFQHYKKMQ